MKLKSLLLLAFAALLTLAVPRPARALEVSFDFFYDSLSPYGEWMEVGDYGYCWRPSGVDAEWTPYSDGYWTYTDAGWTWVSYEDYGGIVYHYGRWTNVEDEGWCWVPDYEWGPAWVSWRKNDDYVGWAPLPAEAHWQRDRGISVWADATFDIGPASYSFCRIHDFGAPVLRPVIIRRAENIVIINNTVNITNITYNSNAGYIFNGGLDYAYVNRFARRPIPALKLVRNTNVTVVNNTIINNNVRVKNLNAVQQGNQLTVIAPTVVRPQRAQMEALLKPKVTKVIAKEKVTKGWGNLAPEQRLAVRTKMRQETEGKTPENAPAKAIRTADLKVVPVKADPKAKLPTVNPNVAAQPEATTADIEKQRAPGKRGDAATMPDAGEAEKAAREKAAGRKLGKGATPSPTDAPAITATPVPGKVTADTLPPAEKERAVGRQGVTKRFNPKGDDAPTDNTRMATTPVPGGTLQDRRNANAEEAKERAAARQRAMEEKAQQDEVARRAKAQEAATARQQMPQEDVQTKKLQEKRQERQALEEQQAVARKRAADSQQMQQEQAAARKRAVDTQQMQQNQQEQAAARRRAVEAQQMQQQQQQQQQQQALRERAAQSAEPRRRAVEAQPPNSVDAGQVQQRRNMPPAVQRNVPPPAQQQPQRVPGKPGRKPLTPEEAAALQQQQQLR